MQAGGHCYFPRMGRQHDGLQRFRPSARALSSCRPPPEAGSRGMSGPRMPLRPPLRWRVAWLAAATAFLLFAPGLARAAATGWVGDRHAAVRLITAEQATGSAGMIDAGLEIRLAPGWHAYWRNPGAAGIPAAIAWRGSRNLAGQAILAPASRWALPLFAAPQHRCGRRALPGGTAGPARRQQPVPGPAGARNQSLASLRARRLDTARHCDHPLPPKLRTLWCAARCRLWAGRPGRHRVA